MTALDQVEKRLKEMGLFMDDSYESMNFKERDDVHGG